MKISQPIPWIKKQFFHIVPVFIYFFFMFHLINITESFLLRAAALHSFTFWEVTVAALIVAKVVLVIDQFPIVDLFPKKPLIYNTLWKTFLYWFINVIVRLSIRFAPYFHEERGVKESWDTFSSQVNWSLFTSIQTWYFLLFAIYVLCREFVVAIGPAKARKMFFGR